MDIIIRDALIRNQVTYRALRKHQCLAGAWPLRKTSFCFEECIPESVSLGCGLWTMQRDSSSPSSHL
jgi:hypothetical protein